MFKPSIGQADPYYFSEKPDDFMDGIGAAIASKEVKILDDKDYSNIKTENKEDMFSEKFDIIPYSFITALIIKEILDSKNN